MTKSNSLIDFLILLYIPEAQASMPGPSVSYPKVFMVCLTQSWRMLEHYIRLRYGRLLPRPYQLTTQ